ncbi:SGNH family hydrolase [Bartonella rattaustraliani]|uniref:SGNH/GDSL hydrolase family protein n=1 Tax=Bartonella rattaustraliani TaxID=481139 RepID=UPI000523F967|nr:SGNH family hydrolase [Bartonella rattaustraliani]
MSVIHPSPSEATNFFKWLSQHNKQEQPQVREQKLYKPQKKTVTRKSAPKLKEEKAKSILILGDFVASAVAEALKEFFIENNNIVIINATMPNSGLVRTDDYSWKNNISKLIEKNKPDIIVMVIGANDNQSIRTLHGILNTREPEWINIYKQKIAEVTESLHASEKPWIWMGQPAFVNDNLTERIKIFNKLYKQETESAGGYFIDILEGFIDEQGQFSFSGYDINGKVVTLRTYDGINFTPEGKRKLASYLEKKLENILNIYIPSHAPVLLNAVHSPELMQEPQKIERLPPMSLDDMAQQNTGLLSRRDQNFIKGPWFPLNGYQKDRADNFSFP